jgi:hypothetical protein
LSSPFWERAWAFLARGFSAGVFAAARNAMRCSGFAGVVIAASSIAVWIAASQHVSNSTVLPTAGISGLRKDARTTAPGNRTIVAVTYECA